MKLFFTFFLTQMIFLCFSLLGCTTGGDYTKELSGGYFFRDEGTDLHDILSHSAGGGEIPSNVISYNYDDDFIIAAQKPSEIEDSMYEKVYEYKDGKDKTYYWLIVHKQKLLLGPMNNAEFQKVSRMYKVPNNLQLKYVD